MTDTTNLFSAADNKSESLTVILAAFREGENLKCLLPKLRAVVDQITPHNEVLVVDTQSPMDDTEQVCVANGVIYVNRRGGDDYGYAIRTGIARSTGDYVVIMDADGSHAPDFINKLWQARHNADVVIASRYIVGGSTANPWPLVFSSRILNFVFKSVVKIPALDVSNSLRLYRGALLRNLNLTFLHFDILEEILAKLLWQSDPPARIIEIPFSFGKRFAGESKRNIIVFGYHFVQAIFRLRRLRQDSIRNRNKLTAILSGSSPVRPNILEIILRLSRNPGLRRLIKFFTVGATGTVVNQGLLWSLTDILGMYYLYSALISIESSIISNFILNNAWTFRDVRSLAGSAFHRFIKYNLLCIAGSALNYVILWLLTDFVHLNYLISNLFGIAAAVTWNYLISLKWAWARKPST